VSGFKSILTLDNLSLNTGFDAGTAIAEQSSIGSFLATAVVVFELTSELAWRQTNK
jgi:hypothetical protein